MALGRQPRRSTAPAATTARRRRRPTRWRPARRRPSGDDGEEPTRSPSEPEGEFFRTDYDGLADPAGFAEALPERHRRGPAHLPGQPVPPLLRRRARAPRRRRRSCTSSPTSRCAGSRSTSARPRCGAAWAGPASPPSSSGRTAPGRSSAATTATSTSWTPTPASGSSPTSRPATSSRARPPSTPTASRSSTPGRATTSCGSSPSTGPAPAEVLWTLDSESVQPVNLWNDDWDSSPIILDDYMIVGSESSRFWVIKLNRSYDAAGLVQVAPEVVFTDEAWDERGARRQRRRQHASVESSVAVVRGHRLLRHLGRARARATTSAGLDEGEHPDAGVPLLHRRRQRRVARRRRRGDALRRRPERPSRPPARSEVGPAHEARPDATPANPIVWTLRRDRRRRGRASTARRRSLGDIVDRHQRRRPAHRPRPRHRRGAVGAHAAPARPGAAR